MQSRASGGQSQHHRGLQVKLTGQIKAYIWYLTNKRKVICNKDIICMSMVFHEPYGLFEVLLNDRIHTKGTEDHDASAT